MTNPSARLARVLSRLGPGPRRVDGPTYGADVVGDITRCDERDIVFSRRDLFLHFGAGSAEHEAYYRSHPDHLEYDSLISTMPTLGRTGGIDRPMFDAQVGAILEIAPDRFVDGEQSPTPTDLTPARAAEKAKALARLLGADLVGTGPLKPEWVYSHVGRSFGNRDGFRAWGTPIDASRHQHAIAMGFRMDYELIRSAPDFPVIVATGRGYAAGAWVSIQLAEYIRMLGYSARAHHMYNYEVLAVPVAVDCGLGELSRAGFLMTREFGLGLRLGVVTTDMPLAHDRPLDISAQSFCETCRICAENCPAGAIPMCDKVEYNGVRKWKLDEERCFRYWHAVGTDCAVCMISCPWTNPRNWFHSAVSFLASTRGPHQSLLVLGDKLLHRKSTPAPRPRYMERPDRGESR